MGQDWADVLEGMPRDVIQRACLRYMRDEPRRRPTPGAIYALARDEMPKPQVVRTAPPEPDRPPRCTADAAAEIMQEFGYAPKRFGGPTDE